MTGPICEYCGSVLDQAEIDRQEQELAEKRRQYEELLRQWNQSKFQGWVERPKFYFPKPEPFIVEQKPLKEDEISFTKLLTIVVLISIFIASAMLSYVCYYLA